MEFWKTPQIAFEPFCEIGNFVLWIFYKFYQGLVGKIPDEIERCRVITDCIYYSDITPLNVFIKTELMKCHIQSYCGVEDVDFEFHSNIGISSLSSYLETKFANHMLSIRKISQHINCDVCKLIPLVPLDRIWTDNIVCEYLKIYQQMYT